MHIRLDKLLAHASLNSRNVSKDRLKNGRVTVDGKVQKDGKIKVDTDTNIICLDGEVIQYKKHLYLMLNKPTCVVSATVDNENKTVIDILEDKYKKMNLFPVGRLDMDTVGLLLLTNDGKFAHNTLSPKKHVAKVYYARVKGEVTAKDILDFKEGVELRNGYKCKPAVLNIIKSGEIAEVEIEISEGKYHQIKKMFEKLNKKVLYLKRIEFCGIKLDDNLREGQVRELNKREMEVISNYIDKG